MATDRYIKNGGYRQWRTQRRIRKYEIVLVRFQRSFTILSIEFDTFVQTCFIAHSFRNIFPFSYIREKEEWKNKWTIERGSNRFVEQRSLVSSIRMNLIEWKWRDILNDFKCSREFRIILKLCMYRCFFSSFYFLLEYFYWYDQWDDFKINII